MTVELKFQLPEDEEQMHVAIQAMSYWRVLSDINEYLRTEIKYHDRTEYQEVRDKLYELMEEHHINLDMVS